MQQVFNKKKYKKQINANQNNLLGVNLKQD